jgi:hypothetical protein
VAKVDLADDERDIGAPAYASSGTSTTATLVYNDYGA